jgi:hypothetical protein
MDRLILMMNVWGLKDLIRLFSPKGILVMKSLGLIVICNHNNNNNVDVENYYNLIVNYCWLLFI